MIDRNVVDEMQEVVARDIEPGIENGSKPKEPTTRFEYTPERKAMLLASADKRIVRGSQLATMEIPETQVIIPGLVNEGLVPIGAGSKTGKSCFTLSAAYDIAEGLPILGTLENERPRKVLYMTLEDPYSVTIPRYDAYRGDKPGNDNILFADSWDLIDRAHDGLDMLDVILEQEPDIVWVIIDVQQKVLPFMVEDASMYARLYELLPPLKQLGYHHHVAISPTMHTRKTNGKPITLEDIYGSQGYVANADVILLIDSDYKTHKRSLVVYGKGHGIRERRGIPLEFEDKTERYTLGESQEVDNIQAETERTSKARKLDMLLRWVKDNPGKKPKSYRTDTGQTDGASYGQINEANSRGLICKDDEGGLYLADSDKCRALETAKQTDPDYDPD